MTKKKFFRPADAGRRFKRNPAEPVQDSSSASAAEFEPQLIAGHRGYKRRCRRDAETDLPRSHQRTGCNKKRQGGDWEPDLLREHHNREHDRAMLGQKIERLIHDSSQFRRGLAETL